MKSSKLLKGNSPEAMQLMQMIVIFVALVALVLVAMLAPETAPTVMPGAGAAGGI